MRAVARTVDPISFYRVIAYVFLMVILLVAGMLIFHRLHLFPSPDSISLRIGKIITPPRN
jgi:hypothetical protein